MIPISDLDAWQAVVDAATPGPFVVRNHLACVKLERLDGDLYRDVAAVYPRDMHHRSEDVEQAVKDCDFIALARTALPALLAAYREAMGIVQDLAAMDPMFEEGCNVCLMPGEDHYSSCPYRRAVELTKP